MAIAVGGKTVRGAAVDGVAPHLLSAATGHHSLVLAPSQVPDKTSEIPIVAELLADLREAGHELTAMVCGALHAQHRTAKLLHQQTAGYVLTVKGNQPTLLATVQDRLRSPRATGTPQRSRGHGRAEQRSLSVAPADGINFPGTAQAFRLTRHTGHLEGQRTGTEVVYGITNLSAEQAILSGSSPPIRGHWSIENRLHC